MFNLQNIITPIEADEEERDPLTVKDVAPPANRPLEEKPEVNTPPITPPIAPPPNVEVIDEDMQIITALNNLSERGYLTDYPEGLDPDNIKTSKDYEAILEYNFQKRVEEGQTNLINDLSDIGRQVIEYELRGGTDTPSFIKGLQFQQEIISLDVNKPEDQETIIRQSMKLKGISSTIIEDNIEDLKTLGKLEKRAKELKPELDAQAEKVANQKLEDQRRFQEEEKKLKGALQSRVVNVLQKGKVGSTPINKEQAQFLYSTLTNENVPITLKGKNIEVSATEAIFLHHKYSKDGNLEGLMNALLVLQFPDQFNQAAQKAATTEVTRKFINDSRYSASKTNGVHVEPKENTPPVINNNRGFSVRPFSK